MGEVAVSRDSIAEVDNAREKENLRKVEAALFVSGKFLTMKELVALTDLNPLLLRDILRTLEEKYRGSGIEVVRREDLWKMDVHSDFIHFVNRLATGESEFTKAEQETLAIIAHKQPMKQSILVKMFNFIELVFYIYLFIALYMTSLLIFIWLPNRKRLFDYPKGIPVPVSIVMPCYNESSTIAKALDSLLNLDYPKDLIEIIVVDDRSKDNSVEIVKRYVQKYPGKIKLMINSRNSGGAAEPTNIGVKAAKYEFIAVTDADSAHERDALIKMIGFLQADRKVAAVTCAVMAHGASTFMQKLQMIEYSIISWSRKLLDCIDAVYVTPGPFALYRKSVLLKVGLFDTKNLTQDIEIVWRLKSKGYMARMSLGARVYSETPMKFKQWWRQRIRWN